jgi:Na+-transporting methylmalonyl-CoA/oxaloacetate decarboxylase gamma subunit
MTGEQVLHLFAKVFSSVMLGIGVAFLLLLVLLWVWNKVSRWWFRYSYEEEQESLKRLKYGKYDGDDYSKCMDKLRRMSGEELEKLYEEREGYNYTDHLRIAGAYAEYLTEEDRKLHPVGDGRMWTSTFGHVVGEPIIRLSPEMTKHLPPPSSCAEGIILSKEEWERIYKSVWGIKE